MTEQHSPESFGLDLSLSPISSPYLTAAWRKIERERLEAWLVANGWVATGGKWHRGDSGPVTFRAAIKRQLTTAWHGRLQREAQALPPISSPPFWVDRNRDNLTRREREQAHEWLLANGVVYDDSRGGWDPYYVPGSKVDWSLRSALGIMLDRYLARVAELHGWDWAGFNGHPRTFETPEGKRVSRRRAVCELVLPTVTS